MCIRDSLSAQLLTQPLCHLTCEPLLCRGEVEKSQQEYVCANYSAYDNAKDISNLGGLQIVCFIYYICICKVTLFRLVNLISVA